MQTTIQLNHGQIVNLLRHTGSFVSTLIEGDMGSGKSSILKSLAAAMPGYVPCYVDCTRLDVGDVQIPAVDMEAMVVRMLPNSIFGTEHNKPVLVMLDELGKASRPVQNALLPLILEKRIGQERLSHDSIIFATTNKGSEGVGDIMQPHARNRMSTITMRKPNMEEWVQWGLGNGIHEAMLGFAREFPMVFQSFEEVTKPDQNEYIFHPQANRRAFVTPRSMELASHILHKMDDVADNDAIQAQITGAIGPKAASDLMAFILLAKNLPRHNDILNDPKNALVPKDSAAAQVMVTDRCVSRCTKEDLDAIMTYIQRLPREMQAMFAVSMMRIPTNAIYCAKNRQFTEWATKNSWAMQQ